MISALSALPIVSLPPNERSKITSIFAIGGKLLVGLSNGTLQVYHVQEPFSPSLVATLNSTYKDISTQAIEKIGLVQDAGILVILSNSIVSVYDLDTYSLDENLLKTKGATTFATIQGIKESESQSGVPVTISRLIVACKRRLVCYEWRDTEFIQYKETQLQESIKSLCFADIDRVICGLSSEFSVVDLISNNITTVVPENYNHAPSAVSVGMSYIGIGSKMAPPLCVGLENNTSMTLPGSEADYDSLAPDQMLALKSGRSGGISQLQPQPQSQSQWGSQAQSRKSLLVRDIRSKCIDSEGNLISDYPNILWNSPPKALSFSYPYLIDILQNAVEIRNPETTTILQSIPIPNVEVITDGKLLYMATAKRIYRLLAGDYNSQIQKLAENGDLVEAISMLTQIEPVLVDDKENKLRQLQILRARELFKENKYEEALLMFSDISAPPDVVIELFPDDFVADYEAEQEPPIGTPRSATPATPIITPIDVAKPVNTETATKDTKWNQKNLNKAVRALLPYLADSRRKISKLMASKERVKFHGFELSEEIYGDLGVAAALVDTTLFKCYMLTSPSLVGPLVRVSNHCDPSVVETKLSEVGKWRDLIDFYFGKKMHREALKLLDKLSKNEDDDSTSLSGPGPTVQYLQRLNDDYLDIIFEFASWPISIDKSYGREIFLEDSSESLSLSRPKVFKYLLSLPSHSLCLDYLEHLINDLGETSPLFHNNLATLYIKTIQNGDDDSSHILSKLIEFLTASTNYKYDRILHEIPTNSSLFYEARAILHGKLGQHKKALQLLVFDINDHVKARKYCSDVYGDDKKQGQEALHILLTLYLESKGNEYRQNILDLLSSQGPRMSPIDVISNLPADFKLNEIDRFLQSQIRTLTSKSTSERVDASLFKVHLIRTQEQLLDLTQKSSIITNHRTCKMCMKRLGHSVISIFPNGVVVHYGCQRAYQEMLNKESQKSIPLSLSTYKKESGP